MIHYDMPQDEYHGLPMFSASMAWDIVGPDGCLALAWHRCPWLNGSYEEVPDEIMENGTLIHASILEPEHFQERFTIIDARDYRTRAAQELRDDARANGLIPILYERAPGSPGPSFVKILAIRRALENSEAAPLLFGEDGYNEVSFTWEIMVNDTPIPCKGRADRVIPRSIVDLKSAPTASPEGFERSTATYGHHARAAFYLAGWLLQDSVPDAQEYDYRFVVVQKEPPYLVTVYQLSDRALEWGSKLCRRALELFAGALKTGNWPAFKPATLDLPVWAEHRLADQETAGEL